MIIQVLLKHKATVFLINLLQLSTSDKMASSVNSNFTEVKQI